MAGEWGHAMVGCKVAEWHSDEFELVGGRVENLHVAREVLVSLELAEIVTGLIGDISEIQLVVSCTVCA
jgi:hypothetical protein